MMNVGAIINRYATYYSQKIAVVDGDKRYTFAEVNQRANRLANGLLRLDVGKGSRIASLDHNCHQHIEINFAMAKTGGTWIQLNPRLKSEELAWLLNDAEAGTLIMEEAVRGEITPIRPQLTSARNFICFKGGQDMLDYEELIARSSPDEPQVEIGDEDIVNISYTAGTTGQPKGIMLSHRSQMAVLRNLLLDMIPDLTSDDVFLSLQPLYHAGGVFIMPCWVRGATHVIVPRFDPEIAFPAIEKERVTIIKTVPTVLQRLVEHPDRMRYDLSSVRTIIWGGSPMPKEKLKEAIDAFGPILIQNYGQTEAPMTDLILTKEDHKDEAKLESAGRLYTMVEAKIVDDSGKEVGTGELGELILRGDHLMTGYWNRPAELTTETLRDGWIYTRDIARKDEKGYFYLVDRKSDMIVSGGLNVYPNEVEQVLYEHPAVSEAAVIGVPDEQWGEGVKAVVVLKPGAKATAGDLIEFCKDKLASYKKPRSVDFVDSLPKSGTGKILRREVKEPYWKGHGRRIH
jgi:acyl-CoA synthetase (AMP-forming)/AMP-acid ligase II